MNFRRPSFESDDHSPFAGPEYTENGDGEIFEAITEAFANDGKIGAQDIVISVEQGVVTLNGRVPSSIMKLEAESVAENIPGVRDIFNLLTLDEFVDSGRGLVKK